MVGGLLTVTHSATDYQFAITSIGEKSITFTSPDFVPTLSDTFSLNEPTFIHGTQKKAKPELSKIISNKNITYPLVYLQEIQVEKVLNDPLSQIYSEPQVRMWFLFPSDVNWITDQHYTNVIEQMKMLAENIIELMYYTNLICERTPFDLVYHANVGSTSDLGHLRDLFNDHYSGLLLVSTLSINKQQCC